MAAKGNLGGRRRKVITWRWWWWSGPQWLLTQQNECHGGKIISYYLIRAQVYMFAEFDNETGDDQCFFSKSTGYVNTCGNCFSSSSKYGDVQKIEPVMVSNVNSPA
ncbi:hypothetical protein YC2023_095218 [Brassica napus]|uniref:(rape) hypothetical protein n=1 Tax=Brassica napus TaxID=3708 RepID=A0A817A8T5_BRANA|nr:unnamed protein product [Brassica napus]